MLLDEYAIVLDYLPNGYPGRRRAEPVAQALGTELLTLLELAVRPEFQLKPGEKVYIGREKRDKIKFIMGRISTKELTNASFSMMQEIVAQIIREKEKRFVHFFNHATMITPRMHQLELLPGIGKKHVEDILDKRKAKQFESFDDIRERVKLMPDPAKTIEKRVAEELEGNQKYYLFVPAPAMRR